MVLLFCLVGLIFIGLSIPLIQRKIRPNAFYGLRVAETLENEIVWYEANARSGKDLLWLGVGTIIVSGGLFALPWQESSHYELVCCGLLLVGVIIYAVRGIRIARAVKRQLG